MGISDSLRKFFDFVTGRSDVNATTGQGRVVDEGKAKALLEKYKAEFEKEAEKITDRLINGDINARQWKSLVVGELRFLMITSAAAGAGGLGMLSPADIAKVDQAIQRQIPYLENFAAQIERTPPGDLKFGKLKKRTVQYFGSARPLLEQVIARAGGRPELPFNPAQKTDCGNNCHCQWKWVEIDPNKGDYDVFWKLADVEHCMTCSARAAACNPLQIRNGQIITDLTNPNLYSSFND